MNRYIMSLIVPPIAVCRFGCAGCCAAPITVFWIAGLASLAYGYLGGPLDLNGISWYTMGLGALLWIIASVWATITIRSVKGDQCKSKTSSLCGKITPKLDETDPLEEIRKAH